MALVRSGRETKEKTGRWRSKERVVQDGVLVYPVGAPIPREEAERQGLVEKPDKSEDAAEDAAEDDEDASE